MLLLALIALGVPLAVSLRDRVDSEVRGQARSQADVVAATASELIDPTRSAALERLAHVSAESVRGRVIVVDRRGRLLADSAGSAVAIEAGPGRIEVLDEGPGLAPGEEETVFERFSLGSAGRRGPSGTGLGLPIARELTRQWGGEVTLSNRDGGGLRAVMEMPR